MAAAERRRRDLTSYRLFISIVIVVVTRTSAVGSDGACLPTNCAADDDTRASVYESADGLYLLVLAEMHAPGPTPFSCSGALSRSAVQNVEGVFWALDEVNRQKELMSGAHLGAIVVDTCGQRALASRDVLNVFSGENGFLLAGSNQSITLDNIVAVIELPSGGGVALADVLQQFPVARLQLNAWWGAGETAAEQEVEEEGEEEEELLPPQAASVMHVAASVESQARAFGALLKSLGYSYASVLFTETPAGRAGVAAFRDVTRRLGVCVAVTIAVPSLADRRDYMERTLTYLRQRQSDGARAVVLWLDVDAIRHFLRALRRARLSGALSPGDFVLLLPTTWGDEAVIVADAADDASLNVDARGSLALAHVGGNVANFQEFFLWLEPRRNARNVWFSEFWHDTFHCNPAVPECIDDHKLFAVENRQNHNLVNTMNSVQAAARALGKLRKMACSNEQDACPGLDFASPHLHDLRSDYENLLRHTEFAGADGATFRFDDAQSASGDLSVLNYVRSGNDQHSYRQVGVYADDHLSLIMRPVGYSDVGTEVALADVPSRCLYSCDACAAAAADDDASSYIVVPGSRHFLINAVLPVHDSGALSLGCGAANLQGFHAMLGFLHALRVANDDDAGGGRGSSQRLGGLIMDSCSSRVRAECGAFSFVGHGRLCGEPTPADVPGALGTVGYVDMTSASSMATTDVLLPLNVTVATPSFSAVDARGRDVLRLAPVAGATQALVMVEVMKKFQWDYVAVVYSDDAYGKTEFKRLREEAAQNSICLAIELAIDTDATSREIKEKLTQLESVPEAKVVVVLLPEAMTRKLLQSARKVDIKNRVWFGGALWGDNEEIAADLEQYARGAITLKLESYSIPGFEDWVYGFSLEQHAPIPSPWFHEFWQHQFGCRLSDSSVEQRQYEKPCTGSEMLNASNFRQQDVVFHMAVTVGIMAQGLRDYMATVCRGVDTLAACLTHPESRSQLHAAIQRATAALYTDIGVLEFSFRPQVGSKPRFHIMNLQKGEKDAYEYKRIGVWDRNGLSMLAGSLVTYSDDSDRHVPPSTCTGRACKRCMTQFNSSDSTTLLAARGSALTRIRERFETVWGLFLGVLSALGFTVVLICLLYFIVNFSVRHGSTILGYTVLVGVGLLYAINFAFIAAPMLVTCVIQRVGLGVTYAIIYSGFFIKVMNGWRLNQYQLKRAAGYSKLSTPGGLLVISLSLVLVQCMVAAQWIILVPPAVEFVGGAWVCAPTDGYHSALVLSLVYVISLLLLTVAMAWLCCNLPANNYEARWILMCLTFSVIVWIAWTCIACLGRMEFRDPAVCLGNFVNATVIMLSIYLPKVYIFKRYKQETQLAEKSPVNVLQQTLTSKPYSTLSGPAKLALPDPAPAAAAAAAAHYPGVYHQYAVVYNGGSQFNPGSHELAERLSEMVRERSLASPSDRASREGSTFQPSEKCSRDGSSVLHDRHLAHSREGSSLHDKFVAHDRGDGSTMHDRHHGNSSSREGSVLNSRPTSGRFSREGSTYRTTLRVTPAPHRGPQSNARYVRSPATPNYLYESRDVLY